MASWDIVEWILWHFYNNETYFFCVVFGSNLVFGIG